MCVIDRTEEASNSSSAWQHRKGNGMERRKVEVSSLEDLAQARGAQTEGRDKTHVRPQHHALVLVQKLPRLLVCLNDELFAGVGSVLEVGELDAVEDDECTENRVGILKPANGSRSGQGSDT